MIYTVENHPENDLLIEFAFGDETDELQSKEEITKHVDECPSCSRYISEMKGITNALQGMPDFEVPRALHKEIVADIKNKTSITGSIFNFSLVNWYKNPFILTFGLFLVILFLYIYMIFVLK